MFVRYSVTGLLAGLAVLCGMIGAAPSAYAQEYRNWDRWGGPQRFRPPPPPIDPYDENYNEPDEPRYAPLAAPRPVPRPIPRRDASRYDDDREEIEREEFDRQYQNRRINPPYRVPRRYDDQNAARGGYNRDDSYRRDTAREPQQQDEQTRVIGSDGGGQPYIEPLSPPRVAFSGGNVPGSIVIDTSARRLYYVTGPTSAFAYPIGVGREGFAWTGSEKISRIADWPDWYPPAEMRKRKPELPERMMGGIRNPLGVKAMYLGNTLYRIHGTNDPKSIGKAESSGCFRMLNAHVLHLASLAGVGTQVTIVNSLRAPKKVASRVVAPSRPRAVDPRLVDRQPRLSDPRLRPLRWRDYDRGYYR